MYNSRSLFTLLLLSFLISSCARKMVYNDPIPAHESFTIESKSLNESRVINVWLPSNYAELASLPVLYMPDGGLKEDFPHLANTIAALVQSGEIEAIILVGIENTERGRDLTGFSGNQEDARYCPIRDGDQNFRSFILEELVLTINEKYRVSAERGLIGESLAGLFVMETLLEQPEAFTYYIAIDPSLWWNNHYLVSGREQTNFIK